MSTTAGLISECKRYVFSGQREAHNRLNGALDDSQATVTLEFELKGILPGTVISVDLELMYVWSTTPSNKTASVTRGWEGSTAATHADDSVVTVNPKFSDFDILKAINADLSALSAPTNGLFQMKTAELTYNPSIQGYDLTSVTDLLDVYEVRYNQTGPAKTWPTIRSWVLKRSSETDVFASGNAIVLYESAQPGRQLRVLYKAPYGQLATLADDVQTVVGLSTHADDIPPLGAASRLAAVREVHRNFDEVQGDTRRAEEVPAGAQLRGASGLMGLRAQRIMDEAARLAREFPNHRKGR